MSLNLARSKMDNEEPEEDPDGLVKKFGNLLQKPRLNPEAIKILEKIPTIAPEDLKASLYKASLLSSSEENYRLIQTYIENGIVHGYGLKIRNVVRIIQKGKKDLEHTEFAKKFRLMLWHGTREKIVGEILKSGFILPQSKNQMFGPGIYFADRISKSVNYCPEGPVPNTNPGKCFVAYLLLCDVALGRPYNAKQAHNEYTEEPKGFKKNFGSVMCTGGKIPDREEQIKLKSGCYLPLGKTIANDKFSSYAVQFNEFIVYDTNRIRIRYVVEVEVT